MGASAPTTEYPGIDGDRRDRADDEIVAGKGSLAEEMLCCPHNLRSQVIPDVLTMMLLYGAFHEPGMVARAVDRLPTDPMARVYHGPNGLLVELEGRQDTVAVELLSDGRYQVSAMPKFEPPPGALERCLAAVHAHIESREAR